MTRLGAEEHNAGGDKPQNNKGDQTHPEHPVDLVAAAQCVGLRNGLGHGHGQARGGDHQQQVKHRVGVVEVAEAHVPQDAAQRNLVQGADELDDHNARSQRRRPTEKRTFLR